MTMAKYIVTIYITLSNLFLLMQIMICIKKNANYNKFIIILYIYFYTFHAYKI